MALLEQGGLSDEELKALREQGEAQISRALAQRGLMDSGLMPGAKAALEGELALAKARARGPYRLALAQQLMGQAQQPTLLGQLIPLALQYGLRGPAGDWWIPPYNPQIPNIVVQGPSVFKPRKGSFSY